MTPESEIEASFFTKSEKFSVSTFSVNIPRSSDQEKLNEIIQSVLQAEKSYALLPDFDFLIKDEYLVSSVGKHLEEIFSNEEHVLIEYIPRQKPPEKHNEVVTDECISTVHTMGKYFLAGSFDNGVHIGNVNEDEPIVVFSAHVKPVKCARWIRTPQICPPEGAVFVTASYDQTVKMWHWDFETNKVRCIFEGKGHRGTLMTCAVSTSENEKVSDSQTSWPLMATGSWDKTLKVWSLNPESDLSDETGGIPHKRKNKERAPTRIPLRTFDGHKEAVSGITWKDGRKEIVSCSWDRTLRVWDSESGEEKVCIHHSRVTAFNSVSYSPLNHNLLTSANDTFVRTFDPRGKDDGNTYGQGVGALKAHYSGHHGLVFSAHWAPHKDNQFVSGSVDSLVKLWDTRNTRTSLYDIQEHELPVLEVDWTEKDYIVSASEDKTVKVYHYRE